LNAAADLANVPLAKVARKVASHREPGRVSRLTAGIRLMASRHDLEQVGVQAKRSTNSCSRDAEQAAAAYALSAAPDRVHFAVGDAVEPTISVVSPTEFARVRTQRR
jgi:hypothetical protein